MKLLLAILFLVVLVGVIVFVLRRRPADTGYRRRFENRYRRDPSGDAAASAPMFIPGVFTTGSEVSGSHHHALGQPVDCGVHGGHTDGGATSCGTDGGN